jgi:Delta7-sterol 5-desaturase
MVPPESAANHLAMSVLLSDEEDSRRPVAQEAAMSQLAMSLLAQFLRIYGLLIGIYILVGLLVSYSNHRWASNRKIQGRTTPYEQIRRDVIQSTISLVQIALFLAVGLTLRAAGFGIKPWESSSGALLAGFCLSLLLFDTWFYWGHRLLHSRFLYRRAHQWHHLVTTPSVWSNNSDTFLDNAILQSYWMIAPLLFPAPGIVYLLHKVFDQVSGMIGHSGHEYNASTARFPSPLLAVLHHDQHHRHLKYNFATHFVVWDRLMKTLHPQYDRIIDQCRFESQTEPSRAAFHEESDTLEFERSLARD